MAMKLALVTVVHVVLPVLSAAEASELPLPSPSLRRLRSPSGALIVELDGSAPRVLSLTHNSSGARFSAASASAPAGVTVNRGYPPLNPGLTAWFGKRSNCSWSPINASAATWQASVEALGLRLALFGSVVAVDDDAGGNVAWILESAEAVAEPDAFPITSDTNNDLVLEFHGFEALRLFSDDTLHRDHYQQEQWTASKSFPGYQSPLWSGSTEGTAATVPPSTALPEESPTRSIVVGGWLSGFQVGAAVHSSQGFTPLRTQLRAEAHPQRIDAAAVWSAPILVRARSSRNLLPFTMTTGCFSDITHDGIVDSDDVRVWFRRRVPDSEPLYLDRVWFKIDLDSNSLPPADVGHFSWAQAQQIIAQISLISDGHPLLVFINGATHGRNGSSYLPGPPEHINSNQGSYSEFLSVVDAARTKFNTLIGMHTNMVSGLPVVRSDNGSIIPSPVYSEATMCRDVDGSLQSSGSIWNRDPAQRPPALAGEYLASHTKDILSGFFEERVERAMDGHTGALMRSGTMHIDAFRDTQVSWEPDGTFIGSDVEFEVGIKGIHRILAARNITMSIEGAMNNMAANTLGIIKGAWVPEDEFLTWRKIVGGYDQSSGSRQIWNPGALGGGFISDICTASTDRPVCNVAAAKTADNSQAWILFNVSAPEGRKEHGAWCALADNV